MVAKHVAHLVLFGHNQHNLLGSAGDTSEDDGEAVARIDGVQDIDGGVLTTFCLHIRSDVIHCDIVTLRAGDHRLGDTYYCTVANVEFVVGLADSIQHTFYNDSSEIVTFSDDGAGETHSNNSLIHLILIFNG